MLAAVEQVAGDLRRRAIDAGQAAPGRAGEHPPYPAGAWSGPVCIGRVRYPDQMMRTGAKAVTFVHQAPLACFRHPAACLPTAVVSTTASPNCPAEIR
jgi:hypothetical protein